MPLKCFVESALIKNQIISCLLFLILLSQTYNKYQPAFDATPLLIVVTLLWNYIGALSL